MFDDGAGPPAVQSLLAWPDPEAQPPAPQGDAGAPVRPIDRPPPPRARAACRGCPAGTSSSASAPSRSSRSSPRAASCCSTRACPLDDGTYRTYRFPWSATPKTKPGRRRPAPRRRSRSTRAGMAPRRSPSGRSSRARARARSRRIATVRKTLLRDPRRPEHLGDGVRGARPRFEGPRDRPIGRRAGLLSDSVRCDRGDEAPARLCSI